jgi:hypothetical protein
MKETINEEVLCVLRKNHKDYVIIDYVKIENPFKKIVDDLVSLCKKQETSIQQIINFIIDNKDFENLNGKYKYCVSLEKPYQGFIVKNQDFIIGINTEYKSLLLMKKENPYSYNFKEKIEELKWEIENTYILWSKAYAIKNTYSLCNNDKSIILYSHRINGWSNPVYKLTPNFSVEIKTNFGFGGVSYFYSKITYKNIEITPFSEWIEYEFARFSEIIRYTKSHQLNNESWLEAIEFCRDACNLSLINEEKFVKKYIIEECEKMVIGLEELFTKNHFNFKGKNNNSYSISKEGHILTEFRGEKISGALDFISKIMEYDKIISIQNYKERIEFCNKKIQPILIEDAKILTIKIENLSNEKKELQPKYDEVLKINRNYNEKWNTLKDEMINKGELTIENLNKQMLMKVFYNKFPEFIEFKNEYNSVVNTYKKILNDINNNTLVRDKILSYFETIKNYFKNI